jgi:hypothetical protein
MATRKTTVWLVESDDGWKALYINGKSVFQDHGLKPEDLMELLQEYGLAKDVDFKTGSLVGEEADQMLMDLGHMPVDFADIEDHVASCRDAGA